MSLQRNESVRSAQDVGLSHVQRKVRELRGGFISREKQGNEVDGPFRRTFLFPSNLDHQSKKTHLLI